MRDRHAGHGPGCLALGGLDLLPQGGQVVVGHVVGGLGAHHETVLVSGEGDEELVALRVAAEEALDLAGLHVAQVQKGPVALVRAAAAAEVDRISLLVKHPLSVGQEAKHRRARRCVAVPLVEVEPQARGALVHVQEPGVPPAADALALGEHQRPPRGTPAHLPVQDAMLGLEDLLRLGGEGCIQAHEPVTVGHLGGGISAVQRLDPEERVRSGGTPGDSSRADGHAVDRHLVGHGQRGDGCDGLSAFVPDLDLVGKAPPGDGVGPGTHQTLHEQEPAVRGELGGGVEVGLTQRRHLPLVRVDQHQLGCRVVLEEGVVVGGLKQIARLVGGAGRAPCPLEDLRTRGDGRRLRGGPPLRDAPHQEAILVRPPAHGGAEKVVEGNVLDLRELPLHRAHPQAHVVGVLDGEGEALAVRGPGHVVDLRFLRQIERCHGAAFDLDQAR